MNSNELTIWKTKKIKTELLKSGLPLESTVAESIASLSDRLKAPLTNHGEYFFQRRGCELPSSIDFAVMHDIDIPNCDFLEVLFLIECKYRTTGTNWFFVRNSENDKGMEFFIENFYSSNRVNRKKFPSLIPPLNSDAIPVAGKGTEVYGHGQGNEKSITEAIHQLMFASSSALSRGFINPEDSRFIETFKKRGFDLKGRGFHTLICPVLLTNADLYFLRSNVDKVEQSEKLEDVCTKEQIMAYVNQSPPYVRKYITDEVFEQIKPMLLINTSETRVHTYLTEYSILVPCRYYILNYKNVEKFITDYIELSMTLLSYACNKGTKQ